MDAHAKFWSRVSMDPDGCWLFLVKGAAPIGYARLCVDKKTWLAHRYAWFLVKSYLTPGMHIDHLCRRKACVRPDHLEEVTGAENTRRWVATVEACVHGHALTPENVYIQRNGTKGRSCKTCRLAATRKWYAAHEAAALRRTS